MMAAADLPAALGLVAAAVAFDLALCLALVGRLVRLCRHLHLLHRPSLGLNPRLRLRHRRHCGHLCLRHCLRH